MIRSNLRWWLWVCFTYVALGIAGMFGLVSVLWHNDVTFIGFGVLAGYFLATGHIAAKVYNGDRSFGFLEYIADSMERAGIFGTFCGLVIAFQAIAHRDAAGLWIDELMSGVGTKFFTSLVGMACGFMLRTQLKILGSRDEV